MEVDRTHRRALSRPRLYRPLPRPGVSPSAVATGRIAERRRAYWTLPAADRAQRWSAGRPMAERCAALGSVWVQLRRAWVPGSCRTPCRCPFSRRFRERWTSPSDRDAHGSDWEPRTRARGSGGQAAELARHAERTTVGGRQGQGREHLRASLLQQERSPGRAQSKLKPPKFHAVPLFTPTKRLERLCDANKSCSPERLERCHWNSECARVNSATSFESSRD